MPTRLPPPICSTASFEIRAKILHWPRTSTASTGPARRGRDARLAAIRAAWPCCKRTGPTGPKRVQLIFPALRVELAKSVSV
jgi:hypothetical protein